MFPNTLRKRQKSCAEIDRLELSFINRSTIEPKRIGINAECCCISHVPDFSIDRYDRDDFRGISYSEKSDETAKEKKKG